MLKELFTAALGMQNRQTQLEVVANNIANANTTGYKRASVFERNLVDARANFYNVAGDVEQNDPPIGSYYDYSVGNIQQTSNPLDLALEGKGFFVLQNKEGQEFLTRSGNFTMNESGEIVTSDGKFLMGEDGPRKISNDFTQSTGAGSDIRKMSIRVAENGEVYANDLEIGKLAIAEVNNLESLQRISNQDFLATGSTDLKFLPTDKVKIRQGWLEGSNVNIVNEMVEMIELQRMFEAGSKVIQTNDGTLDRSIAMGRFY
jgi:flagellar basal-body rod protein FlgF